MSLENYNTSSCNLEAPTVTTLQTVMSRSKVVPTSSARPVPTAREDSLFEPSSLTDSDDSNEKENIRNPKLSVQHLRKLVQYNRKILSPKTHNDFGVASSGSSESTEEPPT